jgi:hypothetical protein
MSLLRKVRYGCAAVLIGLWLLPAGAAPPLPESPPDGLVVEWAPPRPDFRPLPDGSVELVAEGYEIDGRPGALRLPFTSALVAIPPGTSPTLRVLSAQTTVIPLPAPLAVAPEPVGVIRDEDGHPVGPAFAPAPRTLPPPPAPVVLEEVGTVRGVRLARLTFYPALPERDRLQFYQHIRVEIRFSGEKRSGLTGDDPILARVRRAVLNPQDALVAQDLSRPVAQDSSCSPQDKSYATANVAQDLSRPVAQDLSCSPQDKSYATANVAQDLSRPVAQDSSCSPQDKSYATANVAQDLSRTVAQDLSCSPQDKSYATANVAQDSSCTVAQDLSCLPMGGPRQAFLEVSRPGLYRVTYAQLAPLGLTGADPHYLHLFRGTEEVAYEWEGDEDTLFEDGESLLFYAEPRFSRWTRNDTYRLVLGGDTPGLRMTSRSADPTGLPTGAPWVEDVFEENRLYTPDLSLGHPPGPGWRPLDVGLPGRPRHNAGTYPFSAPAVDASASHAHPLADRLYRWRPPLDGPGERRRYRRGRLVRKDRRHRDPPIRTGVLRDGANALSLRPVLTEGAWLDAFAVRHARGLGPAGSAVTFAGSPSTAYTVTLAASGPYRAYDVTDPLRPVRLTGLWVDGQRITLGDPSGGGPRRYHVAAEGAIRAPDRVRPPEDLWGFRAAGGATGANYLIITHPAFADALGPLIDLRRSQGLTVAVVNVLGIYDAYGDGRPDPEAIRRFIADAYANWNPRPVYVLLVGDGSFDPKQYRSESPPTYIPPYLLDVGPAGGETAADNRYACVDGDDNLPDLLLGRLPVRSADEARAIVQKIVDYETRPLPGGWNASVLLVADDPDAAGDFPAISDSAAAYVTAPFTTTRRYCAGSNSSQSDCPDTEGAAIHSAILNDWNRGTLLVQYTGHSSWQQWAVERFFHLDDLPALHNSRRLPVLVEATCFTGAFHRPEPTLDEELVTRPDAGAVAAWGPTGLGASPGHQRLAAGFFRAVFSDTVGTVGEATLAGKLNLLGAPVGSDLLDTFVLLGDPALHWNRTLIPWTAHVFLPLVRR